MNINNLLAGVLGWVVGMTIIWVTWTPVGMITTFLTGESTELGLLVRVSYALIILTVCFIAPIKLGITDDSGE